MLAVFLKGAAGGGAVAARADEQGNTGDDRARREPEGTFGIRLLEAPVIRRDDPRAYTSVVDHLNPGTTIHRRIEVSNTSSRPLSIDLYAAAASIEKQTFTFAAGRTQNELTEWTSVDRSVLRVPPDSKTTARITIRVPRAASRGERYGVVWAEVAGTDAGPVKVINRVGIRIYLDVGPGGEPPSAFEIEEIVPRRSPKGEPEITAQVHNTGERALEMTGKLWLSDGPGGLQAGPFVVKPGTTLSRGDRAQIGVTLDKRLPEGPWKVRLTLRSGRVEHTATATLRFPASGVGKAIVLSTRRLPLYVAAAAVVTVMSVITLFLVIRRLRTRPA